MVLVTGRGKGGERTIIGEYGGELFPCEASMARIALPGLDKGREGRRYEGQRDNWGKSERVREELLKIGRKQSEE